MYENTETYQVEVVIWILRQILVAYLEGNVKQLEGRISNQILGVNGWKEECVGQNIHWIMLCSDLKNKTITQTLNECNAWK